MLEPSASRFWQVALQSGLMDAAGLQACWDALPLEKRTPDAIDRRLARLAVQSGRLTLWQGQQLVAGRSTGFKIDRYVLLDLLGQGGMGRVYLARDTRLNRLVAVKILSPERVNNPRAIARFHREALVGAQLQHENLVRIYDEGESNGRCYLVMEYIEGRTIGQMIAEGGPLAPVVAARLARQVALGLQHAQRKGLIHRDVNPYNILVTQDGVAKLTDMGLAIDLADQARVTRDGATVGTFDYVSPEQARHSHDVDTRSDIYSLGCSLYHMISGQVPFPSASLPQKLLGHQAVDPEPLVNLVPGLAPGLAAVVARMMRKAPEERFATPLELAQALEPFAAEGPVGIHDAQAIPLAGSPGEGPAGATRSTSSAVRPSLAASTAAASYPLAATAAAPVADSSPSPADPFPLAEFALPSPSPETAESDPEPDPEPRPNSRPSSRPKPRPRPAATVVESLAPSDSAVPLGAPVAITVSPPVEPASPPSLASPSASASSLSSSPPSLPPPAAPEASAAPPAEATPSPPVPVQDPTPVPTPMPAGVLGGLNLVVDLGPEPSLTEGLGSTRARPRAKDRERSKPEAEPSTTAGDGPTVPSGRWNGWLGRLGAIAAVLLALGGGFAIYSAVSGDGGSPATAGQGEKGTSKDKPGANGSRTGGRLKLSPPPTLRGQEVEVVTADETMLVEPDFRTAVRSAIGSRGYVLLRNAQPLRMTAESVIGSSGLLEIRAGEGVRPVIEVEVRRGKSLLSTRTNTPLRIEGVTIVARYVDAGDDPPPVIDAGASVTLDRCEFRVEGPEPGPVPGSRAVAVEGGTLEARGCLFVNFDRALDLAAFSGSTAMISQSLFIHNRGARSGSEGPVGGWSVRMRGMPGGTPKVGRKLWMSRCTSLGRGLVEFIGFSDETPAQVDLRGCAVLADALVTWDLASQKEGVFDPPPTRQALSWTGERDQFDIRGKSWLTLTRRGEPPSPASPPDGPTDLEGWNRVFGNERDALPPPLRFATDPSALSEKPVPADFAVANPSATQPVGADPTLVGPGSLPHTPEKPR